MPDRTNPLVVLQPTPHLKDLYPALQQQVLELQNGPERAWVSRIGNSLYAMSQGSYPHVVFSPWPSLEPNEEETGLATGCASLDCMTGSHWTETTTTSNLSQLVPPSPVAPAAQAVRTIADAPVTVPLLEHTDESPPITMVTQTPRASTMPHIFPGSQRTIGMFEHSPTDIRNPLLTAFLGLLFLVGLFVKKLGDRWKRPIIAALGVRSDLHLTEVHVPSVTRKPEDSTILDSVVPIQYQDSKPLPPVPVEGGEEEEDDDAAGVEGETEGKKGGKKKKPIRRKPRSAKKKVLLDVPEDGSAEGAPTPGPSGVSVTQATQPTELPSSLVVSDTILGGS